MARYYQPARGQLSPLARNTSPELSCHNAQRQYVQTILLLCSGSESHRKFLFFLLTGSSSCFYSPAWPCLCPFPSLEISRSSFQRFEHTNATKLSLPIAPGLTISAILFFFLAILGSGISSRLDDAARPYQTLGRALRVVQAVVTIVLATLFSSYIPLSDARNCLLSALLIL